MTDINHNGDLEVAKKLIDVAKIAGCDYVKFQKRTIDLVYTKEELDKERESPWGTTNREQKEGLEFGKDEYDFIDYYCKSLNIGWFASPWDVESVKFLEQYDCPYTKIASAMVTNHKVLDAVAATNRDTVISTGMTTFSEISEAFRILSGQIKYVLACTATYPTKDEEMNLSFITELKRQFMYYRVGFSNHSPGIIYSIVAAALGAEMVEFHVTLDRSSYGSDQAASIEPGGVLAIGKHIRNLEKAMGSGKWLVFPSEEKIKEKLRK